jgi:hypothetical protein
VTVEEVKTHDQELHRSVVQKAEQSCETKIFVYAATLSVDQDQDMSDVTDNDNDGSDDLVVQQTSAVPQLTQVRANDPTNNPYMPSASNPTARTAYLQVLGDLGLYSMRTPLETHDSRIRDIYKHLIYERLFHGLAQYSQSGPYRLRGGTSITTTDVSKSFHLYAPRWFAEEKVVLP